MSYKLYSRNRPNRQQHIKNLWYNLYKEKLARKYKITFVLVVLGVALGVFCDQNLAKGDDGSLGISVHVGGSSFTFKAIPEKISPSSNNYSSHVVIEIKNAGTSSVVYSQQFDTDQNGLHDNPEPLTNITEGTYDIYAKGYSHLNKRKTNVSIVNGNNFIDFSSADTEYLLAGDVNILDSQDAWKRGDDIINSIDLAIEIEKLDASSAVEKQDVNKDGIVNAVDLGILIENLDKTGDGFNEN